MAITFNFEIDKKKNSKGHYAIFIRITENRKHKKIKTTIELESLSHWQKKGQRISKKEPNYISWNNTLDKEMEKVKQTYRELKDEGKASTASTIINAIKKRIRHLTLFLMQKNMLKEHLQLVIIGQPQNMSHL